MTATAVKYNAKTCNARIETGGSAVRTNDSIIILNNDNRRASSNIICENVPEFSCLHILVVIISIITYCLDIVFASYIAYYYFIQSRITFFVLTIVFIGLPILVTTAFSMRWYLIDEEECYQVSRPSITRWIIRIILLLLQLVQILRYGETLLYIIKFLMLNRQNNNREKQQHVYRKMLDEYSDSALLRLFHCFLHAAPQAILHLMLLFQHLWSDDRRDQLGKNLIILQCAGSVCWIISISWGLTAYCRTIRVVRDDKDNLTMCGTFVLFLWNLMSTLSRILALSILASLFPVWFGVICIGHWFVMSMWLTLGHPQTSISSNRCEELILSLMLGYAYITAFIATRDGPTRYSYLVYYLVFFMENTGALVVWCVENNSVLNPLLYYGAVVAQVSSFVLALIFMLIYYTCLHPSGTSVTIHKSVDFTSNENMDMSKPSYSKN